MIKCGFRAVLAIAGPAAVALSAADVSAQISFSSAPDVILDSTGTQYPHSLVIADFNGDGMQDVAMAEDAGKVRILQGNGAGTFSEVANFAFGRFPVRLATGDFDWDGDLDLAVGHGGGLSFFNNVRSPNWFVATTGLLPLAQTFSLAIADFNGDGKLDIAAAATDAGVVIYRGNGDGAFTYSAPPLAPKGPPRAVVAGDFKRDGKPDLAMGLITTQNNVAIALNTSAVASAVTFDPLQVAVTTSSQWTDHMVTGDFNIDGKLDLATAGANKVSIFNGNGDGTFSSASTTIITGASFLAVADLDGDGRLDLAMSRSQGVTVLRNDGSGAFPVTMATELPTGGQRNIALGDVNGDGKPDLLIAKGLNKVLVRLNTTPW